MFADLLPKLRPAMPELRGTLKANVPLAPLSWFKTGGQAQILFEPEDTEDLSYFLKNFALAFPITVIGAGSNILIRDGGVAGIVIKLGKGFQTLSVEGTQFKAGAGLPVVKLASTAAEEGIAGFSFLRGIPGSVGGALRMNGGAYEREIADVLISCTGVDRQGELHKFALEDMGFSYRHCRIATPIIFTEAEFKGEPGDKASIMAEMEQISEERAASQPINRRTGGSTFKNPPGHKAWELIEAAGCRGKTFGEAQVSELHCNFLINRGAATTKDLETLGEMVHAKVLQHSGISLEWEILRIGQAFRPVVG